MRSHVIVAALIGLTACGEEHVPAPEGGEIPDVRVSGRQIAVRFHHDGDWYISPPLGTPAGATVAGLMLEIVDEPTGENSFSGVSLQARGRSSERLGAWIDFDVVWHEARLAVARADLGLTAVAVELRVAAADVERIVELTYSATIPPDHSMLEPVRVSSDAALSSELEAWRVRPRSAWGARAAVCSTRDSPKYRMAVHHTAGGTGDGDFEAKLRQIQAFHLDARGWCDVGYHFLVTVDGVIWEGRQLEHLGAHIRNHNIGNIGMAFVGCFDPGVDCQTALPNEPPGIMIEAGGELLGHLAQHFAMAISDTRVKGHRQHSGTNTICPGDNVIDRLDDIRGIAAMFTRPTTPPVCSCNVSADCDVGCPAVCDSDCWCTC
ncbi:MAG: N-acetylmuramoyl-L-alanine amidase, partial [Myxococcota bacterium]